jgi:hypothetical protein
VGGSCEPANAAKGTLIDAHAAGDCRARVCDGQGQVVDVVDLANVPAPPDACSLGICDQVGLAAFISAPAGTPCTSSDGGRRCDGARRCVQCLTSADCVPTAPCVLHRCAPSSCGNGKRDGAETDVDCGGSCAPCVDGRRCKIDQDCLSDACDALVLVCLPSSCIDQKQDGNETDVDCGGTICSGCFTGKKCILNRDCATNVCGPNALCGGNPCADHRQDGSESDVDCGGIECPACGVGQMCSSSFDCSSGHRCDTSASPSVCR